MIILAVVVLVNLLISYLINFLSDVLPLNKNLISPVCVYCHEKISWKQFIFFIQCRNCNKTRTVRHWIVLVLLVLVPFIFNYFPPLRTGFWISIIIMDYFLLVFVIDLEHKLIFYSISIVGALLALPIGVWLRLNNPQIPGSIGESILWTLVGGASGFVIMLVLYFMGRLFSQLVARIKKQEIEKEALGYGDVLVSGIIGLLLGWPGVIVALCVSILAGGIVSLIIIVFQLIRKRYKPFTAIPYAPFFILSTLFILYFIK